MKTAKYTFREYCKINRWAMNTATKSYYESYLKRVAKGLEQ